MQDISEGSRSGPPDPLKVLCPGCQDTPHAPNCGFGVSARCNDGGGDSTTGGSMDALLEEPAALTKEERMLQGDVYPLRYEVLEDLRYQSNGVSEIQH